ncbi:MAG: DEAD/DEAH box helicase [Hyphomicrobiaceae bacterium]
MEPSTFAELGLSAKVLAAIEASGYTTPTPIQAQAIPVAMTGRDVLGIAQTGTGKTAGFVLPMIARLETGRARARMPRSLILAPTRELAAQCAQSFEKYGQNHKLAVALLIGGVSMDDQVQKLDRGVDVLIATPGRLLDHFGRGRIMLMGVEILVIDEADRMLDMGFIPDIEKICKLLPPKRQTLFFSATMPPEITRLVSQFLNDPVRIEVAKPATTAKTITQRFRFCASGEDFAKREVLRELIRDLNIKNAIIFCNRKRDVAILHKSLLKHGFNAGALHGDMDQMSRTATLDKFRAGEIALLAASDVAARGLDIPDVSHVFNFDVPWQADDYVHRIGRTGRAGKEGFSATIVTPEDVRSIESIAKLIGEEPQWIGDVPSEEDLAEGRSRKRGARGRRGAPVASGRGEARGRSGSRPGEARQGRGEFRRRREGQSEGGDAIRPQAPRDETPIMAAAGENQPAREPAGVEAAPPQRERAPQRPRDEARSEGRHRDGQRGEGRGRPERRRDRGPERSGSDRGPERGERHAEKRAAETDFPDIGATHVRPGSERNQRPAQPRDAATGGEGRERGEAPRRDRERDREPTPNHLPRERNRTPRDGGQREAGQQQGQGRTPVGLGDHVPAFLRRPVRAQ